MKTKIVSALVLIAILQTTTLTANAGLIDWIRGDTAKAQIVASAPLSFDQVYASITGTRAKDVEDPTLIAGTLKAPTSPETTTSGTISRRTYRVEVSGYTSEVAQTDDSPFITAKGTFVRDGIVATNFLPFGTRLKIPSLYGDKIFTVEDRMNSRYWHNVDIWFADKAVALKLGRRSVTIEVVQ